MAANHSFDIVSRVDLQEVDNAVQQTRKEMHTRYDFKASKSTVELLTKEHRLVVHADDAYKLRAVLDILQSKLVKRGVPLKALRYGAVDDASGGTVRQTIDIQAGIDRDDARTLVKRIKDTKLRVQAAVQEDQVRVTAQKIDDLQSVIAMLKDADLPFHIQFVNYR